MQQDGVEGKALPPAFADFLETLPDAVVVVGEGGRVVAANANLCVLAGYSAVELIGAPIESLVPMRLRARHVGLCAEYLGTGAGVRPMSSGLDISLRTSDDREVPVDVALSAFVYSGRRLVVATVRNASARRALEAGAERERAALAAVLEVSNVLLDAGALDDVLALVVRRVRTLLDADLALIATPGSPGDDALIVRVADGVLAAEIVGDLLPLDQSVAGIAMREREPLLIADASNDPRFFRPPGWSLDLGGTLVVPLHARGETVGSMSIARLRGRPVFRAADITYAKTLAEKATLAIALARSTDLAERERRLRIVATRSAQEIELQRAMVAEMEEVGRARTDIIAKISHELRAPLTSVLGYVELLSDEVEAPAGRRMLSVVERNAKRLLGLIDDLLTMSLVDAGIMEIDATLVDVELVVKHVCDTIEPVVSKTGLEIAVDVAPNLKMTADRDKVERALLNLVSNAVKFTPPSGCISIIARPADADIEIAVRDTGCGVPIEEQQHLFTRFFRAAHAQSEQVPGVGLGLFIVKQIVDLHHGTISVTSNPQGSTFTMRFPAVRSAAYPPVLRRRGR